MKKILYHPATALFIGILTLLILISLRSNLKKIQISKQNLEAVNAQIEQLESQIAKQEQQLELAQEPLTKEKIIRNELLMKKENEVIIQLPKVQLQPKEKKTSAQKTAWQEWQELLF